MKIKYMMDFKHLICLIVRKRAHLAVIGVFLVCIVLAYQGLGSPPSSSTGIISWLGLQREESSSAVMSAKQFARFKPPVDLRVSDNVSDSISDTAHSLGLDIPNISDTAHNVSTTQSSDSDVPNISDTAQNVSTTGSDVPNISDTAQNVSTTQSSNSTSDSISDSQSSNVSSSTQSSDTPNISDSQNSKEILTTHNVSSETHAIQSSDSIPNTISNSHNSSEVLIADPLKTQKKIPEWRARVEDELRKAKLDIDLASSKNTQLDPQLTKSIYINPYKFYKSYELMERIFKVYMYKEGEPRLVHRGPMTGIYSSEGRFIHEMNQNRHFLTDDPQEAHMFFLPYSVVHMVADLYVPGSHTMLPLATYIKDYVNLIALKHPFWNLTRGSDHFFVSCHDWGPATARDHPELRKNAVKVVCNADLTEEYVLDKDASLPETYLHTLKPPARLGGPGATKRSILAFFAGQLHGRVRPTLLEHWKDKDPDMKIYEVIPRDVSKRTSYEQHMKMSKFCICAMGYEVNSPRIVESIYYDCVPVIIADNFVLPFSDVLNWDSFSLTVAEKDIPRLKDILLSVSDVQHRKMQSRLKRVRQHFMWHDSAERFDIFHMILHSVWMRRLQQLDRITSLEMEV